MRIYPSCFTFFGLLLASGACAQAPYDLKETLTLGGYSGESLASSDARLLYGSDFNGDGRGDLVTKNRSTVTVYVNQSDGRFTYYWHSYDLGAGLSAAVASGDINSDGKADLLVGYPNVVQPYRNDGSSLTAMTNIDGVIYTVPLQSIGPQAMLNDLAFADFNGDTKLDIVALDTDPLNAQRFYTIGGGVVRHRESAALLWGQGGGTFAAASAKPRIPVAEYPLRARVVDLDGDGRPELISNNGNSMNLQYNPASGGLGSRFITLYPVAPAAGIHSGILGMSAGDLNADNRSDLAITYYTNDPLIAPTGRAHRLKLYRNSTHPQLPFALNADSADITLPFPANGLAIADFNSDGRNDLLVALESAAPASIALYAGRGDFTFDPPLYINSGFSGGELITGNFNSDNRLDIAVVDIDNNQVVTYLHR